MVGRFILCVSLTSGIFFSGSKLETSGLGLISNLHALMVVLGGTLSVLFIAYTWRKIAWTIRLLKRALGFREDLDQTIQTLVDLASNYRKKQGIRLLEQQANHLPAGLLKTGAELVTFHYSRDRIEKALSQEALNVCAQYQTAHRILQSMARLAPVLGLGGAFVHLIRFFGNTSSSQDPMGPIAFACLSILYGLILAGLFFNPLANKLKEFMKWEGLRMEIIQEGILGLYDQEHPRAILRKLEIHSAAMALSNPPRIAPQVVLLDPGERPTENKIF
jgi:chemotaxis protein MotA